MTTHNEKYPEGQILGYSWDYIMGKESTQKEKIAFANAITEIVIKYMGLRDEKAYNNYASLSVLLEKFGRNNDNTTTP